MCSGSSPSSALPLIAGACACSLLAFALPIIILVVVFIVMLLFGVHHRLIPFPFVLLRLLPVYLFRHAFLQQGGKEGGQCGCLG